ncbi:tRNA (uridine(34)/cytosine(34)/5-carboxymethylaminomethyluridine(34)-2'-O)-methyltransferase TrmL [Serpentinicella alkaliphila]|uniref:Putative tRNA (cytidine(34)-2'-O)-methyltransferase n=1 Tax=Serpentinicella alkaliphila TaxID=1734049 RepID=A0A4V2T3P0_9FIRM|nr:tRNA (uridine(34)/cytosine(34)/5-carboxymethylaminomethyluridine(34)-2'-O)-methyltransferase TrmL [Serpentinicella alkaliphila]QUH25988.1 tRNA (uridine(34)/cytosine(34)/5-carboxymethylaminomethyluridine(34)-2'-O)-methyltransferase TrmL [Serpentinicella alkaliphila]TCQ02154.1 tRNA (cytidine/uridine-2'-O-)-methyltransferase [Serpentinicella alkaliphila]
MKLNIVLFEPEIPQNTGNIARTCVITNTALHIIGPMGFSLDEKQVKRAGLDYWDLLDFTYYDSYEEFLTKNPKANIYYAETRVENKYTDVSYSDNDFIMFGKETTGIPKTILGENKETCIRIPMLKIEKARSLNLSNSVAIVVYEVLRQWDFPGMN